MALLDGRSWARLDGHALEVDEWIMCMKVLRIKDDAYPSGKIYAQAIPIVSIPIVRV